MKILYLIFLFLSEYFLKKNLRKNLKLYFVMENHYKAAITTGA